MRLGRPIGPDTQDLQRANFTCDNNEVLDEEREDQNRRLNAQLDRIGHGVAGPDTGVYIHIDRPPDEHWTSLCGPE